MRQGLVVCTPKKEEEEERKKERKKERQGLDGIVVVIVGIITLAEMRLPQDKVFMSFHSSSTLII